MAAFLFVLWAGGGNVNPFLGLAEQLIGRGHRVAAVGTTGVQDRLVSAGIDVVAAPDTWLPDAEHVLGALDEGAMVPDVLVVDYMLTGALCAAERSGRKTVALVHTLYRDLLSDGAPWPIQMAAPLADVNELRRWLGLKPVATYGELLDPQAVVLVTAPRELDGPGEVADNVVYAGVLFESGEPDRGWRPPPGDGPLVVVSFSTSGTAEQEAAVLQRVVSALGQLPVRGFVTVAESPEPSPIELPDNVQPSRYVRHSAVLPHADLLVTHAGLGSVVAALAHGVPIVAIPLERAQPNNATAVARIGAGRVVDPTASAEVIASAISEQLADPGRVRLAPDPLVAVSLLEGLTG